MSAGVEPSRWRISRAAPLPITISAGLAAVVFWGALRQRRPFVFDIPCREEMPVLDRLQTHVGVRGLEPYPAEEMRVMLAFTAVDIPATILVDRAGRQWGRRVGPAERDGRAAVRHVQTLIAERTTDRCHSQLPIPTRFPGSLALVAAA